MSYNNNAFLLISDEYYFHYDAATTYIVLFCVYHVCMVFRFSYHFHTLNNRDRFEYFQLLDFLDAVSYPVCTNVQVHICRGWVITHPFCSGDRHRPLPVHGDKSGWDATQESRSASIWWVDDPKHVNTFQTVSMSHKHSHPVIL